MLLWKEIHAAIHTIRDKLNSTQLSNVERQFEHKKLHALLETYQFLCIIENFSEKSKDKFLIWGSEGKKRKEIADRLGMSVDAIRASNNRFDNKLRMIIGVDIIRSILNSSSEEALEQTMEQFRHNTSPENLSNNEVFRKLSIELSGKLTPNQRNERA
ncbi:hypothetical protein [Brevibacillus borstelensis]|uniref:hypothetical protein n=1 Tax=Brevibacillus borstelensis TaxID=45462 RepID=UPI002E1D1B5C|nr:hypothetical protein [Brevibacillus borstelensis]